MRTKTYNNLRKTYIKVRTKRIQYRDNQLATHRVCRQSGGFDLIAANP